MKTRVVEGMMKARVVEGILIGFLALGLVACDRGTIDSNLVSEDEGGNNNVFRTYRVDYSEETNKTLASATFSLGGAWGTTLKLVSPASVRFNGVSPSSETDEFDGGEAAAFYLGFLFPPAWLLAGASGTTYYRPMSGRVSQVTFEFVDNDQTRFRESARLPSVSMSLPHEVSQRGFQVQIFGNSGDENVTVQLSQGDAFESVTEKGSTIRVPKEKLTDFSPGEITVRVEVSRSERIEKDSESLGGLIFTSYAFRNQFIRLQ